MKKKYMILPILIILVIIGIAFYIIKAPVIKGYLYSGDHITINLTVFVDGQEISLDNLYATCIFENENSTVTSNNGILKTAGGKYGQYEFELVLPLETLKIGYDEDIILKLNYLNANNWYISDSDCVINLYTSNNAIITGDSIVKIEYNDGTSYENKYDLKLIKNTIEISWGL